MRRRLGADASRAANLLYRIQIVVCCLLRLIPGVFRTAVVFVAMRYARGKRVQPEVMHLFVGHKLEMKKPRGYPSRRELQAKLVAYDRNFFRHIGETVMDALGKVKGWIGGLT